MKPVLRHRPATVGSQQDERHGDRRAIRQRPASWMAAIVLKPTTVRSRQVGRRCPYRAFRAVVGNAAAGRGEPPPAARGARRRRAVLGAREVADVSGASFLSDGWIVKRSIAIGSAGVLTMCQPQWRGRERHQARCAHGSGGRRLWRAARRAAGAAPSAACRSNRGRQRAAGRTTLRAEEQADPRGASGTWLDVTTTPSGTRRRSGFAAAMRCIQLDSRFEHDFIKAARHGADRSRRMAPIFSASCRWSSGVPGSCPDLRTQMWVTLFKDLGASSVTGQNLGSTTAKLIVATSAPTKPACRRCR